MSWMKFGAESTQLAMGKEVEKEHADTIRWLAQKLGSGPGYTGDVLAKLIDEVAGRIAQDHLKESGPGFSHYYTWLAQMEANMRQREKP
jgi:hypothetical protein